MINLANIHESNSLFDSHYHLIRKIGGGGFSEVWLAKDIVADIEVALKIYTPNGDLDEEGKNDFKREFARLCNLNHSNIIHAIGFGICQDELPYLVMSVCKNGSAKKLIGNISEDELWNFIEQIASGLQYLHKRGIIHQDMKPDNILINSDGQYLIIDFGISTKIRNTLRQSNQAIGGGTTYYMSIECFSTNTPSIYARDIWAFGASLFEIITGDVPFGQYGGVTQKAKNGKVPEITQNISKELKQLIYDCLSFNAWDRPDADEILRRVTMYKEGTRIRKGSKNKRFLYTSLSIGVIICCVLGLQKTFSQNATYALNTGMVMTKNDSLLIAQINEANKIVNIESLKRDISDIDENNLCIAAELYLNALELEVSDSILNKGILMWKQSQKLIDDTYSFFLNKELEYSEIGAESAAKIFESRSQILRNYTSEKSVEIDNEPLIEPDSDNSFSLNK